MKNIIDINSLKTRTTISLACKECGLDQLAVTYEGQGALECKGCKTRINEYGTQVSVSICTSCNREFSVCPVPKEPWPECLADDCASYDPARDVDRFFGLVVRDDE